MVKMNSLPVIFRNQAVKEQLDRICRENDVALLALFGSFLRGRPNAKSDVDILIRFHHPQGKSLLDLIRTERQMGKVFKRKVDLLTPEALSPYFRNRVLKTMRVIYEG